MISDVVSIPNDSLINFDRQTKKSDANVSLREYLVGPENEALLHTFCIEDQSIGLANESFNPVVIHGRIGTGKTHLLQILNLLASSDNSTMTSDANLFSSEFSKASKLGNLDVLFKRYVRAQFLFFDDVHLMKTKPFAQKQIGQIVEARKQKGRPTILTAKLSPNRLEFSSYVTSRLSSGIAIRLKAPSKATRFRIINSLATHLRITVPDEAAQLMADLCRGTADQLNRALVTISTEQRNDDDKDVSIEQVCAYFKKTSKVEIQPKRIIRETAKHYGLKVGDLVGSSRRKLNVTARSVAMYLVRRMTENSFQEIGKLFGNRDHTTVLHAYKKINSMKRSEPHTRDVIIRLSEKLAS